MSTNIFDIYKEIHLNLALCHIRLHNYESAISLLTSLLHYEPSNAKALYLRGKSATSIREFELALNDFKLAKDIKPSEKDFLDQHIKELELTLLNK